MSPVRRFRRIEDMPQDVWRMPGDPVLYRVIAELWSYGARTVPRRFPPGVYRYRSLEELNAQTERWAAADLDALQRRRGLPENGASD